MNREALGNAGDALADALDDVGGNAGPGGPVLPGFAEAFPETTEEGVDLAGLGFLGDRVGAVELFLQNGLHSLDLGRRNDAFLVKPLRVKLADGGVLLDLLVHDRLREAGL